MSDDQHQQSTKVVKHDNSNYQLAMRCIRVRKTECWPVTFGEVDIYYHHLLSCVNLHMRRSIPLFPAS